MLHGSEISSNMATTSNPTEESISLFCDFTGLSRADAITRLRANNNDLQRATEDYFENPNSSQYKWDESQFSMDRHGEANDTSIAFNVQGPDELPSTDYQNKAAPTRPPSRANNPSPFGAPANAAEEDANLERALAESAAESGLQRQEAGIIDIETNSKYFGPANRPEYEVDDWALVHAPPQPIDIAINEPLPSERKRDPEAPAFLRQTKEHRVGFMLSIFHKIPLVRNILLQCGLPGRNYGHNTGWWKGQPILKHENLEAMAREEEIWGEEAHPEFVEELHRLMAFLDKTDRSYGPGDGIIDTKAIDSSFGSWPLDVEEKFFVAIKEQAQNNPMCEFDYLTSVGTILSCVPPQLDEAQPQDGTDVSNDEEQDSPFVFLDLALDYEQYTWVDTLYDAVDQLFWTNALSLDHSFPEGANYAVLSKTAAVFTIRMGGSGLVRPCEVPAVFYTDRYMKDRKGLSLKFQTYLRMIKKKLRLYDLLTANLARCHGQHCHKVNGLGQGRHNSIACLNGIIKHNETLMASQTRAAQWRHHYEKMEGDIELSLDDLFDIHTWTGPYTFLPEEEVRMEKWKSIIAKCTQEVKQLKASLAGLAEAKKVYVNCKKVVTKRLTCQEHEVDDEGFVFRSSPSYHPEYWNPTNKYCLRGVALTSELAYVCVRQEDNPQNVDGSPKSRDQWWKIGYSSGDASPIKTEKATLEDVLHAAGTESKNPILMYASEAAMDTKPISLSDALRMFVRADNRSFQQEISSQQEQRQGHQQPLQDPPTSEITSENLSYVPIASPSKRKLSVGSSVATHGSSRDGLDDVNLSFEDSNPFQESQRPRPDHFAVAQDGPQTYKLGGIVESLANCRTNENDAPNSGQPVLSRRQSVLGLSLSPSEADCTSTEEKKSLNSSPPESKSPEMQERDGNPAPFFTRTDPSTQDGPVDMMDIELDVEHYEGQ
ncbi:hypothetical protein GGR54DRAFT_596851 [Hypoxylon sp. NC1633]|nr:hypothetical protein GGR54DRAFT_596851 [Hypoxylon sp. NC1633]